ncbi:MAG: hypothetical protein PHI23_00490 [Candidatus Peribacteraceae bacterium]|nr:hypothetical protein [Candidatus Peribacteraceae bacterium]
MQELSFSTGIAAFGFLFPVLAPLGYASPAEARQGVVSGRATSIRASSDALPARTPAVQHREAQRLNAQESGEHGFSIPALGVNVTPIPTINALARKDIPLTSSPLLHSPQ